MKVNYFAKNYKISDRFKDVLEKKLDKFNKFFDKSVEAKVNCDVQGNREKLEITIASGSYFFRAEAVSDNMYNNIDLVIPKLERQVTRLGSRLKSRKRDNLSVVFSSFEEFSDTDTDELPSSVAKRKKFTLEPMPVEDAIYHMEALDHDFYAFLSQETGAVNIVYRRKDGKAGLIELDY